MAGWYCMHRGWMEHPLFAGEEFSRAQAWEWLIEHAAWKDGVAVSRKGERVTLNRGELATSLRHLAETWLWSKGKVTRFLADLKTAQMVDHQTDQSGTRVSICNYSAYQVQGSTDGTVDGPVNGTVDGPVVGQSWDSRGTLKNKGKNTHTRARLPVRGRVTHSKAR